MNQMSEAIVVTGMGAITPIGKSVDEYWKNVTAGVCGVLADAGVNILDITQTILQEYFTMVVLVDIDTSSLQFGQIAERLEKYGKESGMEIHIQREEIFDAMHRI